MNGYVEYNDTSPLSPIYPHPIVIGNNTYTSAYNAIQAGENPIDTFLILVRNNRDLYYKYRNYTFQGTYDDFLNNAVETLFIPKREPIDIDRYIYILDIDQYRRAKQLPIEFSLPIIRNVYITSKEDGNRYRQSQVLNTVELYNVFLIGDLPLYVGLMGSFILLDDPEQDVSPVLQRLYE